MAHEKFTELELESQISGIMDSFNFEKVHKHMVNTNHQWYSPEGMSVPSLESIKTTARILLVQAAYSGDKVTNQGTGGFVAYKLPWGMQLTFQLAWAY
jgi:hypothetical protein